MGAKEEIYTLIRNLAAYGLAIMIISSEMPEILSLADQIAVMHEGCLTGIFTREESTEENLIAYATGFSEVISTKA